MPRSIAPLSSIARTSSALPSIAVITTEGNSDWRALFFSAGFLGMLWLACWLIWFARPENASWLGEAERQKILAERGAKKSDLDTSGPKSGLLKLLAGGTTLWGLALTQGCNVYSQYLFLTWLPSYLQTTRGLTVAKTGFYAAIPYAVAVALCILIGLTSDRLLRGDVGGGKRRYMIAFAMVLAAAVLFAPLVNNTFLILALIALSLTGIAATTSLNFALLNDLLPNPRDVGIAFRCRCWQPLRRRTRPPCCAVTAKRTKAA